MFHPKNVMHMEQPDSQFPLASFFFFTTSYNNSVEFYLENLHTSKLKYPLEIQNSHKN